MIFDYKKKETYTQEDIDKLLEDHSGFVKKGYKGYVSKEDYEKVVEELTPFKQEKRKNYISGLVGDMTTEDKLADAIALANISDEDDEKSIKDKVSSVIKTRTWLQKDAGVPIELNKTKKIEKKEKKKRDHRFSNI